MILALIFLLVFSLIIGALANWTSTGLGSALQFRNAASKYYAAEGATQVAVRQMRYYCPVSKCGAGFACPLNSPIGSSPSSGTPMEINSVWVEDWCSISQSGDTLRLATITACLVTQGTVLNGPCTVTSGSASKLLAAQVTYTDFTPATPPTSPTCSSSTLSHCGMSMKFNYWNTY